MLLRAQGRAAWRRFNEALRDRRPPAREVLDGALIIFGGALLLTPGFLSDILGVILLLPPSRAVVRGALVGWFGRRFLIARVAGGAASAARAARTGAQATGASGRPYDVDGEAVDIDVDPPHLPQSR